MRTLVIGDIHGCRSALDRLLDAVKPARGDLVVTLGDYCNRGPDTRGAIERLIALAREVDVVALRGNHDFMMLVARSHKDGRRSWLDMGGRATLSSYKSRRLDAVPEGHWRFLSDTCRDWYETPSHIYVHAGVEPELAVDEQPNVRLHWTRVDDAQPHVSGRIVVCGHSAQRSGTPLNLGHTICIDTGCVYGGWLTCLHVETGRIWQASMRGEQREGTLPAAERW
ncbi:MAG: serine/threonine protein phosphatase [Candidatus Krumholzibacteria bacterium]|nr:serine/threonine protein phosphatase [Candidatus Krumholzibacteria bacterium]